jgi:ubiquitin-conjugating enzyme E2 O
MLEKNEVSVYDLKDHPDFQYRPGTVVIRVANFEGKDVHCTAGQVLDNYPEGMVRIRIIIFNEILRNPSTLCCHKCT